MSFDKKYVFTYVGCTTLGLLAGGGGLSPAVADCIINQQCLIDDGSTIILQDQQITYPVDLPLNDNGSLFDVSNGSTLQGKNLIITAAAKSSEHFPSSIISANNSQIELENTAISANYSGIKLQGKSHLSMKNGSISSDNGHALSMEGGSHVVLDGTQINSLYPEAIEIYRNPFDEAGKNARASLEMKGGFSINTSGFYADAIQAGGLVDIKLKDGHITTKSEGWGSTAVAIIETGENTSELSRLDAENIDISMQGTGLNEDDGGIGFHLHKTKGQLNNVNISTEGGWLTGLYAISSQIEMTGSAINVSYGHGAIADHNSILNLDGVTINQTDQEKFSYGITASDHSHINFKNGMINLAAHENFGFIANNSTLAIENSQINLHGQDGYGLGFFNNKGEHRTSIDNSQLQAKQLLALWSYDGTDHVDLSNSILDANHLVHVTSHEKASSFTLNAQNSQLVGHASLDDKSQLSINLEKGSRWTLQPSKEHFFYDFINVAPDRSDVSFLKLQDSQIVFDQSGSNLYQTLTIGSGNVEGRQDVFSAGGNSSISFNTFAGDDGSLDQNKTDRLIINGDVSGITSVTIKAIGGNKKNSLSFSDDVLKTGGISLIQVSGKAEENSFGLKGGYVTMNGKPFQYVLKAYKPQSQENTSTHWDYRLQRKLASTGSGNSFWQVAPQVASYLIAPTALFQSQLMDIDDLGKRLETPTHADEGKGEFFLHARGGDFDYQSNLTPAQYGYDASIQYKAMQAGGNLSTYKKLNNVWRFGLAGSYGDLTYLPDNVEGAQVTSMQVGRLTPYLNWQHDSGLHANMLISYGRFNGYVSTSQRGRTARLQGHSMAASIATGKAFTLSTQHHLELNPQLQLTYQKLEFGRESDIDGFDVALGNPERLSMRAGFKLQQHFMDPNLGGEVKPYASIHIRHAIKDDNKAWLGENFELGQAGTVLEIGAGLEAAIMSKIHFYGDINWQKNLGRAGLSGLYFNADLSGSF